MQDKSETKYPDMNRTLQNAAFFQNGSGFSTEKGDEARNRNEGILSLSLPHFGSLKFANAEGKKNPFG